MKQYKVHKDPSKSLSEEEVMKHKDFAKLSHSYQKMTRRPKPLYKNPKALIVLVLIALLAWLVAEEFAKEKKDAQPDKKKTEETSPGNE